MSGQEQTAQVAGRIISPHGGYRSLQSFQLEVTICDATGKEFVEKGGFTEKPHRIRSRSKKAAGN